jgi:hypothetical protein
MLLSAEKTKFINFSFRKNVHFDNEIIYHSADCISQQNLCIGKCEIVGRTNHIKYLGIYLDSEVSWKTHIMKLKNKINTIIRYFYYLKSMTSEHVLRTLYFSLVQSRIEYGIIYPIFFLYPYSIFFSSAE